MIDTINFPRQMMPFSKKNKEWRKSNLLWADQKTFLNSNLIRNSVLHKKINYDLLEGKLYMPDLQAELNPEGVEASYIPNKLQHFPIMNSKLNVLLGEELARPFDYSVVVTNPNAISEIENNKKEAVYQRLQEVVADTSLSEEDYNKKIEEISDYFQYEWQDFREIMGNAVLNHYSKEYNMPLLFNSGFWDGMAVGEEIYQCDIVGGEPVIEKINPNKIRVFRSGYSNKIEDADIIILEDYWSVGRIIDTYYESLSEKDIKYLENIPTNGDNNIPDEDPRNGMVEANSVYNGKYYFSIDSIFGTDVSSDSLPYDFAGNIRVLRMYWKSKRAILQVKSYNPITGEEEYNFYPENYKVNTDLGEEAKKFWINEAWEGTMIGDRKDGIFVNMRPRPIQYNRLSSPSRCHFGIVGSIYNHNDGRVFSLVDMMKPYNYRYDAIHDALYKAIAANWGSILEIDLSKVPAGWSIDKWLYFAKVNHIAVIDSYNEGQSGSARGVLAGSLNNASKGILSSNMGNYIQELMNILEYIKQEMSDVIGITRQREGQISNRETVGGVERATLQSSHITEYLFAIHDDVKRRVLECFLETFKIAYRGRSKKFQYILPDFSPAVIDVDGDTFAECDYGIMVDNSNSTKNLQSKLDTLAQAALQTQTLSFSTITKLYSSASLAEKQKLIERDERAIQERQAQQQQQQLQAQQDAAQLQAQQAQAALEQQDILNARDNETKVQVALINAQVRELEKQDADGDGIVANQDKEKLQESIRQFDAKMELEWAKLKETKSKNAKDAELRAKQINKTHEKA